SGIIDWNADGYTIGMIADPSFENRPTKVLLKQHRVGGCLDHVGVPGFCRPVVRGTSGAASFVLDGIDLAATRAYGVELAANSQRRRLEYQRHDLVSLGQLLV